jgi:hypothetical protein
MSDPFRFTPWEKEAEERFPGTVTVPRAMIAEAYRGLKRHYEMPELRKEIDRVLSLPSETSLSEATGCIGLHETMTKSNVSSAEAAKWLAEQSPDEEQKEWLNENDEPLRELCYDYRNAHMTHAENYFQRIVHWVKQQAVRQSFPSARGDSASEQRIRGLMDSVRRNGGMYNNDEILRLQGWLE